MARIKISPRPLRRGSYDIKDMGGTIAAVTKSPTDDRWYVGAISGCGQSYKLRREAVIAAIVRYRATDEGAYYTKLHARYGTDSILEAVKAVEAEAATPANPDTEGGPVAVTVTPHPATEPGALDGYLIACTCGDRQTRSLPVIADQERRAHIAWHNQNGR